MTKPKGSRPNWDDPSGIEEAEPPAHLLAAIIRQAINDAVAGDIEAYEWLVESLPDWLEPITPPHVDQALIHVQIIAHAKRPVQLTRHP